MIIKNTYFLGKDTDILNDDKDLQDFYEKCKNSEDDCSESVIEKESPLLFKKDSHMIELGRETSTTNLEPDFTPNAQVLEKYMLKDISSDYKYWQIPLLKHKVCENLFNDEYYQDFKNKNSQIDYKVMYNKLKAELDEFALTENLYSDFNLQCKNYIHLQKIKLTESYRNNLSILLLNKENDQYNLLVMDAIIECINNMEEAKQMMREEYKKIVKETKKLRKRTNTAYDIFIKLSERIDYKNYGGGESGAIGMNIVAEVLLYTFLSRRTQFHPVLQAAEANKNSPINFLVNWFKNFKEENNIFIFTRMDVH